MHAVKALRPALVSIIIRMCCWWLQESALLRLAERQAGREEELAEARKRAQEAEVRAEDLAQDLTLLQQQVAALKEVTAWKLPYAIRLHAIFWAEVIEKWN